MGVGPIWGVALCLSSSLVEINSRRKQTCSFSLYKLQRDWSQHIQWKTASHTTASLLRPCFFFESRVFSHRKPY